MPRTTTFVPCCAAWLGSAAVGLALAGPHDERRIDDDYRIARAACDSLKGTAQAVCTERARARLAVALAEVDAREAPGPAARERLARVRAEAGWRLDLQRCEDLRGGAHARCRAAADRTRRHRLADAEAPPVATPARFGTE